MRSVALTQFVLKVRKGTSHIPELEQHLSETLKRLKLHWKCPTVAQLLGLCNFFLPRLYDKLSND